jgi:pyruvate/2-oxoglutarate dehydrogenase complex dihydrolipoamide dehydrogenase (E3) component
VVTKRHVNTPVSWHDADQVRSDQILNGQGAANSPAESAERERVRHVRPPGWQNPRAAAAYDLVVLGGGTAGLVSAMGAAGLGARVALVERNLLGGDCLNTGCVPSKALIRSARAVGELRRAAALGIQTGEAIVDFAAVMRRMRARRAAIAEHDAAERLTGAGVDVFFGSGQFADARTIVVDGQRLRFRRAVVATGGRPTAPLIPGLEAVPFLTNETVFALTCLPRRLLIIGAGPIGCELAQVFARFGADVTLFDRGPHVLAREDDDAAAIVQRHLELDGVRLALGVRLDRVESHAGDITVHVQPGPSGDAGHFVGDAVLVAAGRTPNVEALNLEAAGIDSSAEGVTVNDRLRTTNPCVYASGDVCSKYKFTHAADALSRLVLQNALFYGRRKASALVIPWVTYTDPEVAHVGAAERDARESNGRLHTITVALSEIDRAIVDDETDGFVRVHHERGTVRGATIVARHAGEMIGEVVYAMTHGGTLTDLSATVHPYPTQAEGIRKAGDHYRRQALTPAVRRWLTRYFQWTR